MNWQDIIVIAVVVGCVFYAGFCLITYFKSAQKGENPCKDCASGCELRRMLDTKKQGCAELEKNSRNRTKNRSNDGKEKEIRHQSFEENKKNSCK